MRRLLLVLLLALAGCTGRADPGETEVAAVWTRFLGTGAAARYAVVEVRRGAAGEADLRALLPARSRERLGRLTLPPRPPGTRRVAAVLAGCQETSTPRVHLVDRRLRAFFPQPSDVSCYAPEQTLAVFDVPADLADRL